MFFGRDWKIITARRRTTAHLMELVADEMQPIYERNAAATERFERTFRGSAAIGIATTIEKENGAHVLPAATLEIFTSGAEKFARLKQDLAAAQRFIHVEYFIWERDELTAEITALLLDRLAAGVEVRIMYDYVGCISFKKDELKRLAAAGAVVSADVTTAMKLNYRNHRKMVVIDGDVGYTGGMNMGQEYIDGEAVSPPGATRTCVTQGRPWRSCRSSSRCAGSRTSTSICCATSTCRRPTDRGRPACSRRPSPTPWKTRGKHAGGRT